MIGGGIGLCVRLLCPRFALHPRNALAEFAHDLVTGHHEPGGKLRLALGEDGGPFRRDGGVGAVRRVVHAAKMGRPGGPFECVGNGQN